MKLRINGSSSNMSGRIRGRKGPIVGWNALDIPPDALMGDIPAFPDRLIIFPGIIYPRFIRFLFPSGDISVSSIGVSDLPNSISSPSIRIAALFIRIPVSSTRVFYFTNHIFSPSIGNSFLSHRILSPSEGISVWFSRISSPTISLSALSLGISSPHLVMFFLSIVISFWSDGISVLSLRMFSRSNGVSVLSTGVILLSISVKVLIDTVFFKVYQAYPGELSFFSPLEKPIGLSKAGSMLLHLFSPLLTPVRRS